MNKTYILLVLLLSLTILSCDKDECPKCHECECVCPLVGNINETTVISPGQDVNIYDTLKNGTWYITNFLEDGETETSNFSGNSFAFSDSGIVTVSIPGSATISGSWRIGADSGHKELYLDFTHLGKFNDLNDNWDMIQCSSNNIRLMELCDEGIIDYLTFSKS